MASTRNKNNYNNYCHSQTELEKHRNSTRPYCETL